jgi:hypothetical protein
MDTFEAIPHLPGSQLGEEDALLDEAAAAPFFNEEVLVLEKVDGINLVLRREGRRVEGLLKKRWRAALGGRVQRAIDLWVRQRQAQLLSALPPGFEINTEWVWHRVSIAYDRLPAEALAFAARDRSGRPLPYVEAETLFEAAGLAVNPPLFVGRLGGVGRLKRLIKRSQFSSSASVRMEGVIVQRAPEHDELWAKWVEADFREVGPHALSGEKNRISPEASSRPRPPRAR